jgi:hypothetical protein
MRLIGLHGRLHSGKDTAFEALRALTSGVERQAFADPVKLCGMAALGIQVGRDGTREQVLQAADYIKNTGRITVTYDDPRFPAKGFQVLNLSGRQFWQWLGTEGHRDSNLGSSFGEDFWVDNLLPFGEDNTYGPTPSAKLATPTWYKNFPKGTKVAVVTDVRFVNEAERVLAHGGEIWWIDAEERLGSNSDDHPSEQKLPEHLITKTLNNNGSVEAFILDVKRAFSAA